MDYNRVFVRGDTHGYFDWLPDWCKENHTTTNDLLIILGDAGIFCMILLFDWVIRF